MANSDTAGQQPARGAGAKGGKAQGGKTGARAGGKAQAGMPGWMKILIFILLVPLIGVLFASFLLTLVGMVPTILVAIADKHSVRFRDRSFAATVGMTNACGVLPSLADLWARGQTISTAISVMMDPLFWILAFGSAGVGWFIFMAMPPLIAAYYNSAKDARIQILIRKQKGLVEMWGDEVKGDEAEEGEEEPEEAG